MSALGLLAPPAVLPALACAAGLALARRERARRVLVCAQGAGDDARPRGRLLVHGLPTDPLEAAGAARVAWADAGAVPSVLAVGLRAEPLDALLALQDAVLLAPPDDELLVALAVESARELSVPVATLAARLGPVERAVARAGWLAPSAVRRAVDEVLA